MSDQTLKIRVYEIEHDSDLDNAAERMRQAGAASVTVLSTDFEHSESVVFAVVVPEGKRSGFLEVWRRTEFI